MRRFRTMGLLLERNPITSYKNNDTLSAQLFLDLYKAVVFMTSSRIRPDAITGREHDARPPGELARQVARLQQSLKLGAVGGATIKAYVGASHAVHATAEQLWESHVRQETSHPRF